MHAYDYKDFTVCMLLRYFESWPDRTVAPRIAYCTPHGAYLT